MNGPVDPQGAAPQSGEGPDWAAQIVDTLDSVVGAVRSKTSEPLVKVARYLVYGVIMIALGVAALLLLTIGLVRAIDLWIPGRVWSVHLLLGLLFVIAGRILWAKRKPPKPS